MSDADDLGGSPSRTLLLRRNDAASADVLAQVTALAERGVPFWLDVEQPTDDVIDELAEALNLHPLAVEDAKAFGQRAALDVYDDLAVVIGFGLDPVAIQPIEVHAFLSPRHLVTIHRVPCPALDGLRQSGGVETLLGGDPVRLLHALASALHDEFPPCIDQLDARLGALASEVIRDPADRHLVEIAQLNEAAANLRRTMAPGRGLAAHAATAERLPGATPESTPYANDIADDLRQIVEDLHALEERCLSMLGLHASLASNRLAAASRQLTIVATIFLPITFLVGFFGQNFAVLINTFQQGWLGFLCFGVGLSVVSVVATVALLNRGKLR